MNRKGYIFSILAIILIIILMSASYRQDQSRQTVELHQDSPMINANEFLEQFSADVPRAVRITSYRSLLGIEEHISFTGEYLDNFSAAFEEIIVNGTVNGTAYSIMDDATLSVFLLRMQEIADDKNIVLDLSIRNISAYHVSPFVVRVVAHVAINATLPGARWDYIEAVTSDFSIQDLKDPLYTVGTLGRVPAVVRESNISRPYITASNDTAGLQAVWNNTFYVPDVQAPSFLMRFEGNLSDHPLGITSLVDTKLIDSQDLAVYTDRSIVDFIYFGDDPSSTHTIVNMPSEFVLDDDHLALFDATGKTTS